MQSDLIKKNSDYWSELCGSRAAKFLEIEAGDPSGVKIFDNWFFDFYPCLQDEQFIPWGSVENNRVIEIGLGYGSVTRRLSTTNGHVVSVDVAPGAVTFVRDTAEFASPLRASALELPFPNDCFDLLISLGCLHYTGNLEASLRECLRVVRPGGQLIVMVYNKFSYKRWIVAPLDTSKAWLQERRYRFAESGASAPRRVSWFWDRNPAGSAPPHTEFASTRQLQALLAHTKPLKISTINVDDVSSLFSRLFHRTFSRLRPQLLQSSLSRHLGLDLYVTVVK